MDEPREFKPLKDIGVLPLSDSSDLRFYVDEFKGHRFGSIRTFLKGEGDGYSGPTKAGVTFNASVLEGVIEALGKLPPEPAAKQDQELARFPRKIGVELVVRIAIYKDTTGIDLREWVEDQAYKGWSKKGVRIPYKSLPQALGFLREMRKHVVKK